MSDKHHILVTGGAGYIGSHTCKALSKAGFTPVTFDNLSKGHRHAVQWGPLIEGDIGNPDDLDKAFEEYDFTGVIHFAGLIEVGESVGKPALYYHNNVTGSLSLLNAMIAHNVKNIIFSSSCSVYGQTENVPIIESETKNPLNPYAASKLMVEYMLQHYGTAHDLKYVICRYFNACGADPDGEIGEEHDPETHIIPLLIKTLLGERQSFSVFGTDYETPDGTCIRDYIHVSDLADAHVKALRHLLECGESTDLNLGTGQGYSVHEIVEAMQRITQSKLKIEHKERRPGDAPILVANSQKCQDVLGFKPQHSDLETIITNTWDFYRARS